MRCRESGALATGVKSARFVSSIDMPMTASFIRVFLDTEFSNPVDMHLISVGLVSERDDEFYAELVPIRDSDCNEFTRNVVLPQLGKTPEVSMSAEQLDVTLRAWFEKIRANAELVVVSYDFFGDFILLKEALYENLPPYVRGDNIRGRLNEDARREYFQTVATQHHALVDAKALRYAYVPGRDRS